MPPNGLQLNLFDAASDDASNAATTRATSAAVSDTVVMQNLGYFQLQAAPGQWHIRLAEGRATELFELATRPRAAGTAAATHHEVLIHDFVGSARMTQLVVRKQLGKELDDLLVGKDGGSESESGGDSSGSLWSKVSSLVTGKKKKPTKKSVALAAAGGDAAAVAAAKAEEETVHVFSLASGHLYERLMRIMMLSVTKRTSAPVKFWLVENFLSPHFKSTVFAMAKEFGFQVELITYVGLRTPLRCARTVLARIASHGRGAGTQTNAAHAPFFLLSLFFHPLPIARHLLAAGTSGRSGCGGRRRSSGLFGATRFSSSMFSSL